MCVYVCGMSICLSESIAIALILFQKLEFTLNQEPKSPDGKNLSAERVQQELDRLIVTQDVETPDIIDWITVQK